MSNSKASFSKPVARPLIRLLGPVALVALLGANPVIAQPGAPGVITLQSLVQQMVNPDAVAEFPAYANTSGLEGSKDPLARTEYFYSDTDGGNFQRDIIGASGGTEHVMLDVTGPGALTRLFVAGPSFAGHNIRVYLDGSTTPVFTADLNNLMSGNDFVKPPFVYAAGPNPIYVPNVGNVPPGLDLYLPIPFALHALVTYDGPANVNDQNQPSPILDFIWEYTRYLPGTGVTSFTPSQYTNNLSSLAPYYNQLSATANTSLPSTAAYTNSNTTFFNQSLPAGASIKYTVNASGSGSALRQLQANVGTSQSSLEGINLRVDFDSDNYCLNESIGDFFGSGEGLHVGTTQMQSVGSDGTMTERWTMPFSSKAVITLKNNTSSAINVYLAGNVGSYTFDSYTMHFHAYRRVNGPMYINSLAHTMRMMNITGTGLLVGDSETVVNAQPSGDDAFNWWGEGDELMYVDRSPFPTHRGTGSEDYFGYAYGHTTLFQSPWTSQAGVAPQTCGGFCYDGVTVLNRNRLLDVVPFDNQIRYDFEIHENSDPNAQIEVDHTTYFYALPGTVTLIPDGVVSGTTYTIENKISGWELTANSGSSLVTGLPVDDGTQRFTLTSIGTNVYQLQNVAYGTYLSANGSGAGQTLTLKSYSGSCDQQWTIVGVKESGTDISNPVGDGSNDYQSLVNACGYAADVVNGNTQVGATVQQYNNTGSESQIWRFNISRAQGDPIIPNGVYQFINANSLAIDVPNASTQQSQPLQVYYNNGTGAQLWTLNYIANGVYSFVDVNSNLAMDNGGQFGAGGTAVQYPYTSTTNQQFSISPSGNNNGLYTIKNIANGFNLSIGGNGSAGSPLIQEPLGSGNDQTWQFHVVTFP